jgi:hypothetical protein
MTFHRRPNVDAILGQKLLTLDYEIYKELAASDMLERTGRQSENLRDDNDDASPVCQRIVNGNFII